MHVWCVWCIVNSLNAPPPTPKKGQLMNKGQVTITMSNGPPPRKRANP